MLANYYFPEQGYSRGANNIDPDMLQDRYQDRLVFLIGKADTYSIYNGVCSMSPYHDTFVYPVQKFHRDMSLCFGERFHEETQRLFDFAADNFLRRLISEVS